MTLRVEVVSPEQVLFSGDGDMVVCRTTDGEVAFMTGHAPFIGALGTAQVRVIFPPGGGQQAIAVHGGFVEVSHDEVVVLSDVAELPAAIDVERARAAKARAEARLASVPDDADALDALARAELRLEVAGAEQNARAVQGLRANTVIAGVPKAGTSSLFVTLAQHPQVAASAVKETRYFLPIRYGRPLGLIEEYESEFAGAGDRPVRLEATPMYFYGGRDLAVAVRDACGPVKVVVVLREPVARLVSFFRFQRARLRVPESTTLAEYVAEADRRAAQPLRDVADDVWFGFAGGRYADFLPGWMEVFGADLRVLWFEELVARPGVVLQELADWLGIDRDRFPSLELASENRTTGYRNRAFQRVALGVNDRLERVLRRHHRVELALRGLYYRLNGRADRDAVQPEVLLALHERYVEPNARLVEQLRTAGVTSFPDWLRR